MIRLFIPETKKKKLYTTESSSQTSDANKNKANDKELKGGEVEQKGKWIPLCLRRTNTATPRSTRPRLHFRSLGKGKVDLDQLAEEFGIVAIVHS